MMLRSMTLTLAVAVATSALGCIHSNVDENWGKSYEAQIAWQTADPTAPKHYEAAEGLDPETARRVAERYYEGQEQQEQRRLPTVILGDQ